MSVEREMVMNPNSREAQQFVLLGWAAGGVPVTTHFTFPVCGFPDLVEPPRSTNRGSCEICPLCRLEFGVTNDDLGFSYADLAMSASAGGLGSELVASEIGRRIQFCRDGIALRDGSM